MRCLSFLGGVPCRGRESCVPLWSSQLYRREPCAPGRSNHAGQVCRWGVWQNSILALQVGVWAGVGSATLPHKKLHCYRNAKTHTKRHYGLGSWRTSSTKANDAWQWKPVPPGSCQADDHHLLQDHHFHRNMERTSGHSTSGHRDEKLQSLNLRNKWIAMDWLRSKTADHWGAASVFRTWTRRFSSHPGCGPDVVQDSSEGTNRIGGARIADHHGNLPHKGDEN